ncbi:hypothetical protein SAMN04487926_12757 [Paraburkholderia steynii]|uniref:Putative adhesin Stv domain-containing protein n=1 Tax=Paraburkholderia steynii TaxID=1245441 RepID=A0A7Z7BDR3_9BURK|nr:hypothetical protein [Paraburkholderia steynii]SDI92415.1 hypothetical protein SAMN04487926_12757 [Paraburkholderia steynii]
MSTPFGHQRVRSSSRPSPVAHRDVVVVIVEGHGEWRGGALKEYPTFKVPDSKQVVIFQGIGVGLDDRHGQAIARMESVPSRLPTEWDRRNAEYDTEPSRYGGVRVNTFGAKTYHNGDDCPDLVLFNPKQPGFASFEARPTSFTVALGYSITLRAIAELVPAGTQIHWAACTVLR